KVSLMLEILSRRFFLKLNLSDHRSILMDLQLSSLWAHIWKVVYRPMLQHNSKCPQCKSLCTLKDVSLLQPTRPCDVVGALPKESGKWFPFTKQGFKAFKRYAARQADDVSGMRLDAERRRIYARRKIDKIYRRWKHSNGAVKLPDEYYQLASKSSSENDELREQLLTRVYDYHAGIELVEYLHGKRLLILAGKKWCSSLITPDTCYDDEQVLQVYGISARKHIVFANQRGKYEFALAQRRHMELDNEFNIHVVLEFMPPEDDVLPAEEQPLPATVSPTVDSPGYITEFDLKEDLEEEDDEDPEEDPANYLADRDDDEELLAIPTSPPSPLIPLSSPLPRIPSLLFPIPSLPTMIPSYTEVSLGYRAAEIWLRTASPLPLPLSSPLPLLPIILQRTRACMVVMRFDAPSTYCLAPSADVPEVVLPPRKRLCIALGPRYKVREISSAHTARSTRGFRADYGFVGTLDADIRCEPDREIGYEIINVWEDPNEIAEEIPATDDERLVMSDQLNLLRIDRRFHARTARVMESEARASREAWVQSMDASDTAQLVEALTLQRTVQTQMVALHSQQRPARDPAHPDVLEEAGSSS
nr:zinc finger, RING/FYVE/PHD-type [Tanacetum cinerariifolium]